MTGIVKKVSGLVYLVLITMVACNNPHSKQEANKWIYDGVEFQMPEVIEPVFGDYQVSIVDFNAVAGGQVLNTKAIEEAINDVVLHGGGTVIVPRGIWLTGPIVLKSNVNIHVQAGALVVFSPDKDLYPLVQTNFEGLNTVRCHSPIYGKDLENIAITGKGVIDGSGDAWRMVKKSKVTISQWKNLIASGGIVDDKGTTWYPSENFKLGAEISDMNVPRRFKELKEFEAIRDFLRPVMVSLVNCDKVLLDGPVFQNSPAWNIHPLMCKNLTVRNIDVRNPWYSQNGDGIDIESCKNTVLYNSTFDVGDDAICIKSGKDKDGRERGISNENLIVKNCIVYHGHGGVTVGSEMSGGVKNLHVSKCTFIGTDVGLRFKSTRGRGGIVEGIYISDVDMIHIPTNAISFNMYYGGLSVSESLAKKEDDKEDEEVPEVTEETPQFRDIHIKNVTCKGAQTAIYLQGLPEMNLENVTLKNLNMEAKNGLLCMDVKGVQMDGILLKTEVLPAVSFINVKDLVVQRLSVTGAEEGIFEISGDKTYAVSIELDPNLVLSDVVKIGDSVREGAVKAVVND